MREWEGVNKKLGENETGSNIDWRGGRQDEKLSREVKGVHVEEKGDWMVFA